MSTYRRGGPRRQSAVPYSFAQALCFVLALMLLLGGNQLAVAQTGTEDSVQASIPDLAQYPSPEVGFIVGPQLRAGSGLNPFPWFDQVQLARGLYHGERFPAIPPRTLTGTLAVAQGARIVTGTGTRFTHEVDPAGPAPYFNGRLRLRDASGTWRPVQVASVQSDTQLTLTANWSFAALSGAAGDTFYYDATNAGWNYDHFLNSGYYDLALVQYINYYRTGDARYLALARKVADAWWSSEYIREGTVTSGPNNLPPRSQAYAGLMLRALDGRPEMWDYLQRQTRATFDNWLKQRRHNSAYYGDAREAGYPQLYAVMLARVLPDTYPLYGQGTLQAATGTASDGAQQRAAFLADAEDIAVNYFGRLQRADGSWRWDVPGMNLVGIEQPFMIGLYLESAVLLHQLTQKAGVRANLQEQIVRACRHLYRDAYRGQEVVADMPQYRWRAMWYFWGGGTTQNPNAYAEGATEEGRRGGLTQGNGEMISYQRHLNSTVHHAFGYAYAISGEREFLQMGDDIFGASYGEAGDTWRGYADSTKAKDYAMNYRASGRFLAWRLTGGASPSGARAVAGSARPAPASVSLPTTLSSAELIASAFALAQSLAQSSQVSEAEAQGLLRRIEVARQAFAAESRQYVAPESVLAELQTALQHARTALSATQAGAGNHETAKLRLEWTAARLKRAIDRAQRR